MLTDGANADERSHGRARGQQLVPSVLRAVRILDALAAGPPEASLASLSHRLHLPRSSTLALCNSLVETGLLARGPDGTYRIGPHVLELSRSFLGQTDLHATFERVMSELDVLRPQTVVCAVQQGQEAVYIGRRVGTDPLGVRYEIGTRLPAHCTASGLAMLSALSDDEVRTLYAESEALPTLTAHSIASVAVLLERLTDVRSRGYAIDLEETAVGMVCVGASVCDSTESVVGAVAVSMAKAIIEERDLPNVATEVQRLADRMSVSLGASQLPPRVKGFGHPRNR